MNILGKLLAMCWVISAACLAQTTWIPADGGTFEIKNLKTSLRGMTALPGFGSVESSKMLSVDYSFILANHTDKNWTAAHFYFDLFDPSGARIGKPSMLHSTRFETSIKQGEEKLMTFNRGVMVPYSTKKKSVELARYEAGFEGGHYAVVYSFSLVKPAETSDLKFEDSNISISFAMVKSQISFQLTNKTDQAVRIDWNQFSYVDPAGRAHKLMHSGVRIIEREASQPPTVVPPTAKVEDFMMPTDSVSLVNNRWETKDLLPEGPEAKALEGKTFSVFMPLEVNGSMNSYLFTFKIAKVV